MDLPSIPLVDVLALVLFAGAWTLYNYLADGPAGKNRRSLMTVMHKHRLRWMEQIAERDIRVADAALLGTLTRNISLFASTSIFILGGLVAILGGLDAAMRAAGNLTFAVDASRELWEIKILCLLVIFISAFFKFAWALRQFNYLTIMFGAFPRTEERDSDMARTYIERAARVSGLAVRTFNRGMRSYYFGLGALAWFIHPYALMASTALVVWVIYRREFKSSTLEALDVALPDRKDIPE